MSKAPERDPAAQVPEMSVIVVSWNCARLLRECLQSLRANAGMVRYEVIVVDNASQDETLVMVAQNFPEVHMIANTSNLGFARASNQGMAVAQAPLLCLLNPDTVLAEPDTLARLKRRFDAHPEVGAGGCRLVFPDGKHQVGDAGFLPSPRAVLVHSLFLSRLAPSRTRGLFLQDGALCPPYGEVGWVCGACTVVRREIVEQVGGLDESFFLYGEDLEWGCRMNRAGVRVAYFPDISIIHHQGGTQKGTARASIRWIDGVARLYYEYNEGRSWLLFRAAMAIGFLLRAVLYLGSGRSGTMLAYAQHAVALRRPDPPGKAG